MEVCRSYARCLPSKFCASYSQLRRAATSAQGIQYPVTGLRVSLLWNSPAKNSLTRRSASAFEVPLPRVVSMGLQQLEEVKQALPSLEAETPNPSWLLDVTIPPETLAGFREDYEKVLAEFANDISDTSDNERLESFVSSAHLLVRRWLPVDRIQTLENFIHDPSQPSALVIRGLPVERDLPPTGADGVTKKHEQQKFLSETWLIGMVRIMGQPFMLNWPNSTIKPGLSGFIRQIFPTRESEEHISAFGSQKLLDFHADFFHSLPESYPVVLAFIGLRGDPRKVGRTLICDNRELYSKVSPEDVKTLREQPIAWCAPDGRPLFGISIIEGSETNPKINMFVEEVTDMGFVARLKGTPEAVAAYKRVKALAFELGCSREGVWLDNGDTMFIHQRRVTHARSSFTSPHDGNDRWMQKLFVHEGCLWEPAGPVPWPVRHVTMKAKPAPT